MGRVSGHTVLCSMRVKQTDGVKRLQAGHSTQKPHTQSLGNTRQQHTHGVMCFCTSGRDCVLVRPRLSCR